MSNKCTHNYGCLPPKIDVRDYKIKSKKAGVVNFPSSFILRHPKIKNQENVNSCVAHATSSILEYYDNNMTKLSTNFIYGIQRSLFGRKEQGMYLLDACKIAKQYGDMKLTDCPGNNEVPTCWSLADAAASDIDLCERAAAFKIDSYYKCADSNDIKYALMNYGPVLTCIKWHDIYRISKNVIYFSKESDYGYHAVLIYGWNESGWLFQNSWGPTFGDRGCAILPMEDTALIAEARVLVDHPNEQEPALVQPSMPCNLDHFYKAINSILNFFKRR